MNMEEPLLPKATSEIAYSRLKKLHAKLVDIEKRIVALESWNADQKPRDAQKKGKSWIADWIRPGDRTWMLALGFLCIMFFLLWNIKSTSEPGVLELETIQKFGVLACVAWPSFAVLYKMGDQNITLPFSKLHGAWHDFPLKMPIAVWIFCTSVLIIAGNLIGKHDAADITCSEKKWRPMVPFIGMSPIFGKGSQISRSVQNYFGPLLFLDLFGFFGVSEKPTMVMPTMSTVLSKDQLRQRLLYFIPRYAAFLGSTCVLWEVMWLFCAFFDCEGCLTCCCECPGELTRKMTQKKGSEKKTRAAAKRAAPTITTGEAEHKRAEDEDAAKAEAERLEREQRKMEERRRLQEQHRLEEQRAEEQRRLEEIEQPALREQRAFETADLGEDEAAQVVSPPVDARAAPAAGDDVEKEVASAKRQMGRTDRIQHMRLRVIFNTWYIVYQVLLYQWTDVLVAGGLINIGSGTVWEMWSLVLEFGVVSQTLVLMVRYFHSRGVTHQHPTLLILPAFLPFIGNELHIWKDHASQGLAFAVSHCIEDESPTLSKLGLVLGSVGFAATFYPAWVLLNDDTCYEGLLSSHWPPATSPPPEPKQKNKRKNCSLLEALRASKKTIMSTMIGANTKEKRLRAFHGESAHLILHQLFIYFFGGSDFLYLGIMLSFAKMAMFDLLTWFINEFLEAWECSPLAAQRYMLNLEVYNGNSDPILNLAQKNRWAGLLLEFFQTKKTVICVPGLLTSALEEQTTTWSGRESYQVTYFSFKFAKTPTDSLNLKVKEQPATLTDGRKVWTTIPANDKLQRPVDGLDALSQLNPGESPPIAVWKQVLSVYDKYHNFHAYNYDWRRWGDEIYANEIVEQFKNKVLQAINSDGSKKATVIGHSTGCSVILHCLCTLGDTWVKALIDKVIFVAPALGGAPCMLQIYGSDLADDGLRGIMPRRLIEAQPDICATWPGILAAIPHPVGNVKGWPDDFVFAQTPEQQYRLKDMGKFLDDLACQAPSRKMGKQLWPGIERMARAQKCPPVPVAMIYSSNIPTPEVYQYEDCNLSQAPTPAKKSSGDGIVIAAAITRIGEAWKAAGNKVFLLEAPDEVSHRDLICAGYTMAWFPKLLTELHDLVYAEVTVIKATGLKFPREASRPCVRVSIPNKPWSEVDTPELSTYEPVWNCVLVVAAWEPGDELLFEVWDYDEGRRSDGIMMGWASLKNEYFETGSFTAEMQLENLPQGILTVKAEIKHVA